MSARAKPLRRLLTWSTAAGLMICAVTPVQAQLPPTSPAAGKSSSPRRVPARLEVSVLGGLMSGADLGDGRALVLSNQVPAGVQTALFVTGARLTRAPLVEGRLGVRLSSAWSVEVGVGVAQPQFEVAISGDVEGVPGVTATSRLTQVTADAAVMYRRQGRRVTPFVLAGAGYLRQLDDPRTTVETGAIYFGGGGAIVAVAPGAQGFARRLHLRADVRAAVVRAGITLEDERPASIVAVGGLLLIW